MDKNTGLGDFLSKTLKSEGASIMDMASEMVDIQEQNNKMQEEIEKNQMRVALEMSKPKAPLKKSYHIGRNDPCPCGSGKKYKNCCLKTGVYEGHE